EQTVLVEEQRFGRILSVGEPRLAELFELHAPAMPPMIELARTYDTYGVPRDLIRVVLFRHGVDLSEEEFNEQFDSALRELQQQTAPALSSAAASRKSKAVYAALFERLPKTEFTGYQETETRDCKGLAIVVGEETRDHLDAGETGEVVLDRTPFYSEAGGQVGDIGQMRGDDVTASVEDTYSVVNGFYLHRVRVERGSLRVGDSVTAKVDSERRRRTKANHTG